MDKIEESKQISYCAGVLALNGFYGFELAGLTGEETEYKPHGIDAGIWRKASQLIGFTPDNLEHINNKFYLKDRS